MLTYLYVLPEHPPQSQYNAILQLFDAVYFLFLLCKEWQSEEEKKTDGIASMLLLLPMKLQRMSEKCDTKSVTHVPTYVIGRYKPINI